MMMRISALAFLAFSSLGLMLATAGPSSAAGPTAAQKSAIKSACQSDYMAHCSSVPPGGAQSLQCLQQNLASLSAACQSAVNAASGSAASGGAAAAPAAANSSAPAAAGSSGAAAAPAPAVKAAPAMTPRQEAMFIRQSCGRDFRRLCGNVPLGGGNGVACLRANAASLSNGCRGALASLAR
jgi:hypothetical protein